MKNALVLGNSRRSLYSMQLHLARLNDDYTQLSKDFKSITEHYERLADKAEKLEVSTATLQSDVNWLKTYLPPLAVLSIVASGIITLILK